MRELIEAYDEYINLLEHAEASLLLLAYSHGARTPDAQVAKGKELRKKIASLKASILTE